MLREPATARTLAKQFAVGFGIAVLLPMTVWYGVRLFHPPPDRGEYFPEEKYGAAPAPLPPAGEAGHTDPKAEKARTERAERQERFEEAERLHYRSMFFVAYPVGLLAIAGGGLLRVQAVGAGLMFAGLFTLGPGCYSYWDKMGDGMR